MHVAIDARNIHRQMNGLGRYARHLIAALAKIEGDERYTLVKKPEIHGPIVDDPRFGEIVRAPEIASVRNSFVPDPVLSRLSCDVYHSLFQFLPRRLAAKRSIVTLHDFMWIDHPRVTQPHPLRAHFVRAYARRAFADSLARADHAIAISSFTADRALALYPALRGRITVISHGVDPLDGDGNADLPRELSAESYLLVVGNSRPYKNVPAVFRAFAAILERIPTSVSLAICGRGDTIESLRALAKDLGIQERVRFVGSVDNRALHALYRNALALAFPSIIEGFGLPVLEAMAHGCPVVTSNRPPLSEITGPDAILVDPESIDSIAKGLLDAVTRPELRADLRRRGTLRSRAFTWEKAASQTLEIYRSVGT